MKNNDIIKNFACSAPWEGLFINPDGDFRVCCAGKSLGNLNNNTLSELLQGEKLTNLQQDILTKGHSEYCSACMQMEKTQGRSLRNGYSTDLSTVNTTKFTPAILDIRWRNACQLRCLYCNSSWSSTFALWEGKTTKVSSREWQAEVLEFIKNNKAESFKHIHLLGGEPFLLKENEELLELTNEKDLIGIVTNLSIPDMHTLPMYEKILSKNCSILVSLENIKEKFEYVRRNGIWIETEKNYKNLLIKKPNRVGCHMTYNLLSAFSLVETFDWLRSMHPDKNDNRSLLTILLYPSKFLVSDFPKEIKMLAIEEFTKLEDKHGDWLSEVQIQFITHQKQTLIDSLDYFNQKSIDELKEYIELTDLGIRNSFASLWPEISDILNRY